jgi:oligopeptide transport system permease protein
MIFRFLVWKALRLVVVLLGTALITFFLMHAIPGGPWDNYSSSPRLMFGLEYNTALRRELGRRFGLNLPLWRQFTRYIIGDFNEDGSFYCGAVCGNLGPSIRRAGRSVQEVLFAPPVGGTVWESKIGYSVRLVLFGALIVVGLGLPLGILSALRPKSVLSRVISVGLAGLIAIPNFILGLLAILLLASALKIISVIPNWDDPSNWIVPAFVLAVMPMANIARVTRSSFINILGEDYIRTAHAKGLTQSRVIWVHAMRNALVPIITYLGPTLVEMFIGLLIVENLFSFPGFGTEFWQAVLELDYPMIMGLTLVYATGIVLDNILVDILNEYIDPRLRSSKTPGVQ